jgi:feruloyl esterase
MLATASICSICLLGKISSLRADDADDCTKLSHTALAHADIISSSRETLPNGVACRITVSSKPTSDSDIRIEVWIPLREAWNGKFVQAGNGGYAGRIPSAQLKELAARGYIAAGTDDGHESDSGTDGSWALGHPEKLVDFGWRALKETTDVTKALTVAAKGAPPSVSYFSGCSDGGREALMEAQRFPNDFQGIVAGAPGNYQADLMTMRAGAYKVIRRSGGYLDTPQLDLIQKAVLTECGGTESGFIRHPEVCKFDPTRLLCRSGQTSECLTEPQLNSIKALYNGWHDPRSGRQKYPGYEPGAEGQKIWKATIFGKNAANMDETSAGYQFALNYLRYFAFADPNFELSSLDMGAQAQAGVDRTAPILDAENPDISSFRAHGGKLLQYHGWNDQNIPSRSSILYFNAVKAKMGDTSNFYRLFMVPGMLHCSGGAGPNKVDWLDALDKWVTTNEAPRTLVAEAGRETPTNVTKPAKTQLLCPYPQTAKLVGANDAEASSYRCTSDR